MLVLMLLLRIVIIVVRVMVATRDSVTKFHEAEGELHVHTGERGGE